MRIEIFDRMEECTAQEVQRLLPLVSDQRREQALRYKHVLGQYCCLKSWLMVIDQVETRQKPGKDQVNTPLKCPMWEYNEHGKPFWTDGPYFSISHCKAGIAVAVDEEPIGIDIETIRSADEGLIKRVMSAEEQEMIEQAEDPARVFTRLWTQKEAVVKAQGTGIFSFEQLQGIRSQESGLKIQTFEKANYIYSIAYGKLHCIGA